MSSSEVDSRSITISMRKSVENLVISSQDAIGQSISQALNFSGVISQHANQIIQETRSVSRSPSPSPRNTDGGPDTIDNDKCSEASVSMSVGCAGGSGDSWSGDPSPAAATAPSSAARPDNNKATSPGVKGAEGAAAGAGAGGRAKKKSWYNALYPTYKSKSDDFKRLFKELPDDERLIVDYSCALQKDILVHGRLYASQNYLCFHASIFSWETSLALRWKDVTAITKEKTALVIPNAILVCVGGDKNFLTSFSGRDKAYLMLFRIWQNALMDQPMSSHEIWQWVHSCYGEELGFNSDDEGYGRDFPEETSLPPDTAEELVESSMDAGGGSESRDESRSGRAPQARDTSPPLVTNGDAASYREEEGGDTLPTDMSDTSDSEPDKPNNGEGGHKCTASHEGRQLLQQEVPFNIDQLFTMMFTNSKFNLELLAARGTTDYVQAPWEVADGLKCRQISYTLGLTSGPIGPKEVHVTETQVMNKCSKPGVLYSIDACSENTGIPYADYFSVRVHYCLARVHDTRTALHVHAHIHYKKSMWATIRGFLEKNAISGLEQFCRLLLARLQAEAEGAAPAARKARRQRRNTVSSQEPVLAAAAKSPAAALGALGGGGAAARGAGARGGGGGGGGALLGGAVLLLLLVNAALYWGLHHALLHHPAHRVESGGEGGGGGAQGAAWAEWARVLQLHAARQRGELRAWRRALDDTRRHLHQTEQALMKLLETIKPSLEGAPPEDPPPTTPRPDL